MKYLNKVYILLIVAFTMLLSISSVSYAAGIVEGNGKKNTPYVLRFDNIGDSIDINYDKKADFWFEVVGNAANGTYSVQYSKEFKAVTITLESADNRMYTLHEHQDDEYYVQAGVIAMPDGGVTEPEESLRTFSITTLEEIDKNKVKTDVNHRMSYFFNGYGVLNGLWANPGEYEISNTHVPGGEPKAHHPNYFVFSPWGTVKDLYEEHAKKISVSNFGANYIKYGADNNAEYILDPRYNTNYSVAKKDFEYNPTRTIIFGKYPDYTNNKPDYVDNDSEVKYKENYALKIKYHFKAIDDEPEEKAGIIETAITKILIGLGMLFMIVIKLFLGSGLTMDSVIFNRYDMTVIDFRGRVGFFANENVRKIINVMYDGFEKLAIIANIIILLYLGIQIVLSVGTDKQSKYFKHLQNWLVGLLILFLAPHLFPFLTDISNAIVGYVGSAVTPHVTQYNVAAVLDDESILGEDADTAYIKKKAEAGRAERAEQIGEKKKDIDNLTNGLLNSDDYKAILEFHNKQQEWAEKEGISRGLSQEGIKELKAKVDFMAPINDIMIYLEQNRSNWNITAIEGFEKKKEDFNKKWGGLQSSIYFRTECTSEGGCRALIHGNQIIKNSVTGEYEEVHSQKCQTSRVFPIKQAIAFINNDQLLESHLEIGQIEAEYNTLDTYLKTKDLMTEMRIKAGTTGRVTYVIIWYLLIFQLISVLSMYFKRLIMISILIMIFPIVMITYAIDKINDGKAQTLETWFKEFSVNIFVQVAHAVIYVTLIKTGLEIYEANPKNWLIFIIAVTSLFPMERLLRGIFGMTGGTIGQLKANVGMGAAVAWGAVKGGVKAGKSINNFRKDAKILGVRGAAKMRVNDWKEKRKERKKEEEKQQAKKYKQEDNKAKKQQAVADRKKRTRDSKIQLRREKMKNASGAKKLYYKTLNAASMVRNGMYHAGNLKRKIKGLGRTAQARMAGRAFKKVGGAFAKANLMGVKALSGSLNAIQAGGNGAGIIGSAKQGALAAKKFDALAGKPNKNPNSDANKPKTYSPARAQQIKAANAAAGIGPGGKKAQAAKPKTANTKVNRANNKAQKRRIKNVKRVNKQINVKETSDNNSKQNNA